QGAERVALVGANGVGKTTLLKRLIGADAGGGAYASTGAVAGAGPDARAGADGIRPKLRAELFTDRVGYLPQRTDQLDDAASVLENVRAAAPTVTPAAIRNRLARFLVRGDTALRPVSTLSGGERFRVAL